MVIKIKSKLYPRIFFSVLFIAIIVLAFYITRPFLATLVTGAIIAYLSYPLYKKALKHVKSKNFASLIVTIVIVLLLTLPVVIVITLISKEAYATYTSLSEHNLGTNFLKIICNDESSISCRAVKGLVSYLPQENLDYYMQVTIQKITGYVLENVSGFLASIPSFLLNFFVMIFVVYYLLKDGDALGKRIKNILPLKEPHKQHVLDKFHDVTTAVFYGNISVAILQGILGALGFFILGISSPVLWGFVMMIFALIPFVGTAVVWLPAALNLVFIGYLQNDNSAAIRGVVLIIYGAFVISSIDNILKPRIIGSRANVHPILVLLGVLGGLNLFGFIGLIIGPVMLALLMTFVGIYEEEKAELEKYF
ncbi:AI-2E family transporter [Candidatus Woesearchaeota archaeon]|nr:AI-2E family transporter [Candidatus Woesearchaeota archaeon]